MPHKTIPAVFANLLLLSTFARGAYDSITPAQLHERLVKGDTLLILDVRESASEYRQNHIAEPAGQLPLTPVNMPWTSGVLRANSGKLPKTVDIIVHCASGGRSKSASAFLADTTGFTRIFNLLGGFNAWSSASYEKRSGGFGDGSGAWSHPSMATPVILEKDSAGLTLYPAAFTGMDSLYCEIHFAFGMQPVPADAPVSEVAGLFRVTALDRFGLSRFTGDSLTLRDTVSLSLTPHSKTGAALPDLNDCRLATLTGPGTWRSLPVEYRSKVFHRGEIVLRQWYDAQSSLSMAVRRLPETGSSELWRQGSVPVFDLRGRRICSSVSSQPGAFPFAPGSAMYLIGKTPGRFLNLHN